MEIKKATYQGYIWKSDADAPEVIDGDYGITIDDKENPFIIEGLLYNENEALSYHIKYVDGKYKVIETKVDLERMLGNAENFYANHKLIDRGIVKLKFYREWNAVEDEACNDWKVLQPGKLVFIGFERKEETK